MKLRFGSSVFLLGCILGCSRASTSQPHSALPSVTAGSAANSVPSGIWLSPELEVAKGQSIDAALAMPFDGAYDVTLSEPQQGVHKTLRNCLDYLPVEHSIYSAGSALDFQGLRAEGARCYSLDLLRSAKPAVHPTFHNFSFEHVALKDLPPGFALTISNEELGKVDAVTAQHGSILTVDKTLALHPKGDGKAELVAKDWTANLAVYGHADFLGNGQEQLLVRRDAAATHGTYASTTIFLLSQSPDGTLYIERQRP